MVYVEVVPVHTDEFGRITEIGTLLRVSDDGSVERTLVAGRVLYHERPARGHRPQRGQGSGTLGVADPAAQLQPFTVAEVLPHSRAE